MKSPKNAAVPGYGTILLSALIFSAMGLSARKGGGIVLGSGIYLTLSEYGRMKGPPHLGALPPV